MRQKRSRQALAPILVLVLVLSLLSGCQSQSTDTAADTQESQEGSQIYYLNKDETTVVPVSYEPEAAESGALIDELLEQLAASPEDTELTAVFTQDIHVAGYTLEDGMLSLQFGTAYQNMKKEREILCRAAVVNTLCQVPEVEYISFLVGDNPLLDSKETPIGPMNADSFEENTGSNSSEVTESTVNLYFANAGGDKLVTETVIIRSSSNVSVERRVVEQLISGPLTEDAYPTIPPETNLLSISTKDGICYVNLDNGFLAQGYDVTEAVPIYSIVNSLTEIPGISRVQILVNGETDLVYRESIRFDTIFSRNLDIIEENIEEE